jgi:predicted transport protein
LSRGDFTIAVQHRLGAEAAGKIDWSGPRVLCIAGDFTRYDEYAVGQISRNIELLRYRRYGGDLLLLELVRAGSAAPAKKSVHLSETKETHPVAVIADADVGSKVLDDVWESLQAFLEALGDDVQMKELEHYVAFRRLKNFACVKRQIRELLIWARLDPSTVALEEGFSRSVKGIGHAGTGDLEIRIKNAADLMRAQPLLLRSYQGA